MKVIVLSEHLQKILPLINRAISIRSQLPVLQNIYIQAKKGMLILKGTDLELGIEAQIPANIQEEGVTMVSAKPFSELINSFTSEKITLTSEKARIDVKSKTTKSTFQTQPTEDYPRLYEEKGEKVYSSTINQQKQHLYPVVFAAGSDNSKPILTGVYMEKKNETLEIVATDGYRLSLQKIKNPKKKDQEEEPAKPIIVPVRIIREVLGLKTDGSVDMYISHLSNQILIQVDTTIFVSRLIEGTFPSYEKIIPTSSNTKVIFDGQEMYQAVKVCSIFAKDTGNVIRIKLEKNRAVISANTPSVGENVTEVEATLTGEENEIAFNARYLLELFNNVEAQEMVFEMTGPLSPGVFKIKDNPSFLHLIMPIRLQE